MVTTTTRTAYSSAFAQGADFTCGLFDQNGRMIAQDQGVPVHAGALGDAVRFIIEKAGSFAEGDVYVHNDPYNTATHQADGMIVRPIYAGTDLVGFAANRGHWTDIGGMAPGGWSGVAEDVIQEGLIIPGLCLMRNGQVVPDIREVILRNVRMPVQLWGDIQAQIASNIVAERRIRELVRRYGLDGYFAAVENAIAYSRRRFIAALAALPDGIVEATDFHEDDGHGGGPLRIRLRLIKDGDRIIADFSGTDIQARAPVNCTLACTKAAVICPLLAVTDPETPLNSGVIEQIEVIAPVGTLVNPSFPAPTFGATADAANRVAQTVLLALAKLAPERVPAGSYFTGNNVTGGVPADDGGALWYSYSSGGCGARFHADGNSAEWHVMGNSKNESMELWEARFPVRWEACRLIEDSGGAGTWRGGLGTERRIRVLAATRLTGMSDHHFHGPHGAEGGLPGSPNGFALEREGVEKSLQEWFGLPSPSKFANLPLLPGDVFVSITGGGGGYGIPAERDREAIAIDLREGYVTESAARTDYDWRSDGSLDNNAG